MDKKIIGIGVSLITVICISLIMNNMLQNDSPANSRETGTPTALMVEAHDKSQSVDHSAFPISTDDGTLDNTSISGGITDELKTTEEKVSNLSMEKKLANIRASKSKEGGVDDLILGANNSSYRIRATAITMLGKSNSTKAVEPLINAMMDESMVVRERAQNALKKLAGIKVPFDPAGPVQQREKAVDTLREMMPDIKARLNQ